MSWVLTWLLEPAAVGVGVAVVLALGVRHWRAIWQGWVDVWAWITSPARPKPKLDPVTAMRKLAEATGNLAGVDDPGDDNAEWWAFRPTDVVAHAAAVCTVVESLPWPGRMTRPIAGVLETDLEELTGTPLPDLLDALATVADDPAICDRARAAAERIRQVRRARYGSGGGIGVPMIGYPAGTVVVQVRPDRERVASQQAVLSRSPSEGFATENPYRLRRSGADDCGGAGDGSCDCSWCDKLRRGR